MQTLELKLPTPVLLVWGLPENSHSLVCGDNSMTYQVDQYTEANSKLLHYEQVDFPKGNWQLIGKLSELTEEKIATFVEGNPASDKFCMAIESAGYYVTNDLPDPELTMRQGNGSVYYGASDQEFQEYADREDKTLPANTLIFKRV